jgi:hypothetical protein
VSSGFAVSTLQVSACGPPSSLITDWIAAEGPGQASNFLERPAEGDNSEWTI